MERKNLVIDTEKVTAAINSAVIYCCVGLPSLPPTLPIDLVSQHSSDFKLLIE